MMRNRYDMKGLWTVMKHLWWERQVMIMTTMMMITMTMLRLNAMSHVYKTSQNRAKSL